MSSCVDTVDIIVSENYQTQNEAVEEGNECVVAKLHFEFVHDQSVVGELLNFLTDRVYLHDSVKYEVKTTSTNY
tara:strand:- start:154 stop:375 length:222 start_codon:yes stop_codon:yes gene_type:complete